MINDRIPVKILANRMIANVSEGLAKELKLPPDYKSIAMITTDCDDVTYCALDEATKAADVQVVYAQSMYAGAGNATTKNAGEVIGILAGASPGAVKSGLAAAVNFIENGTSFQSANDEDTVAYFAHCVSRTGTYLSTVAGVPEGEPLAYLIAPPLESIYAIDAAMKAADVELVEFYAPPTETNFGGALLTGTQSACKAACEAFAEAVQTVAANSTAL